MEYGLIGEKLGHSISPQLHRMFAAYDYRLCELKPEALDDFLKKREFKGLNVTIPYKRAVIPYCDRLTPKAKAIGSVNTLYFDKNGSLVGENTDYDGFTLLAEKTGVSFSGKKVLLFGSGGTSLTAYAAAVNQGAKEVVRVSRSGPVDYGHLSCHRDAAVLLNTTPVGMFPNILDKLIDLNDFPDCEGLLDVIYNPLRTRLVMDAMKRGIPASGGLLMLVGQARRAAECFTGEKISEESLLTVFQKLKQERENIILCGMPGSGKSTIGEMTAKKMERPFWDVDKEIYRQTGTLPGKIIEGRGERAFRDIEQEVTAKIAANGGCVIALGGGTLLRDQNVRVLRQNGKIVFLRRPLQQLELAHGRPLSQSFEQLTALYQQRKPIYEENSDWALDNVEDIDSVVEKMIQWWNS